MTTNHIFEEEQLWQCMLIRINWTQPR